MMRNNLPCASWKRRHRWNVSGPRKVLIFSSFNHGKCARRDRRRIEMMSDLEFRVYNYGDASMEPCRTYVIFLLGYSWSHVVLDLPRVTVRLASWWRRVCSKLSQRRLSAGDSFESSRRWRSRTELLRCSKTIIKLIIKMDFNRFLIVFGR